ncbi:uncharacterized protein LOC131634228 [Vicia villosa]|uniref:uncharacterized protein LOC131634228 n=1 Tax=Vicia villosa TaxID=3911 RepID=UPI00273C96F2|nr:uncharacterized protein LOC131634228 [Vicia villosa]
MKILKIQIIKWNKEVYGWIDLNIEEAGKEMHFLDNKFAHFAGNVPEEVVEKRPTLSGVHLKSLSEPESLFLERPFTEKEVEDAIWSCDGNKSAGPDGYSLEFYKRFWLVIRKGVLRLCNDFHGKGSLVKSITSSFLALIPKNNNPQNLGEYRPICLVGSIYKIIAKILAARLKEVIGILVSNNQTAFVPGRTMMDGVLLVNELLYWMRKKKRGCILLKVDFEKAYDSVSWQYLREMMMRMGFGDRWMKWMDACIFTSHMSVLVNGSATKEFKVTKGLRQGDPLSPFLFVLAMEGLTALVRKSIEVGDFKPFKPKEKGGLGVRDVAEVNKALLLKWKWRILREDNAIWSRFISLRYHCPKLKMQASNGDMSRNDDSIWWRDITNNNLINDFVASGFTGCFSCCCKNGKSILFWHSLWLGDQYLRELYPDLFDMSTIKNCAVADVLVWNNGKHYWELEALFRGGAATVFSTGASTSTAAAAVRGMSCWARFCADVNSYIPIELENDNFVWRINPEKEFLVASISNIVNVSKSFARPNHLIKLLKAMWELKIPPKMKVFAWRFFIEKIPSKDELLKRGVTSIINKDCVFCGNHPEVISHLFFNCHVVKEIWKK